MPDAKSTRSRFWQTPNFIDDLELSIHAYRLMLHILRSGRREFSTSVRILYEQLRMTNAAISKAKKELVEAGLIRVTTYPSTLRRSDLIEVNHEQLWKANEAVYSDGNVSSLRCDKLKKSAVKARKQYRKFSPKRMETVPQDFTVSDEMRSWAKHFVPKLDLFEQTERFFEHYSRNAVKVLDWDELWKQWMQRTAQTKVTAEDEAAFEAAVELEQYTALSIQ